MSLHLPNTDLHRHPPLQYLQLHTKKSRFIGLISKKIFYLKKLLFAFIQNRGADFAHPFVLDLPLFPLLGGQLHVVLVLVEGVMVIIVHTGDGLVIVPVPFAQGKRVALGVDLRDGRLEVVELAFDGADEMITVEGRGAVLVHGRLDGDVPLLLQPAKIVLEGPLLAAEEKGGHPHNHPLAVGQLDLVEEDAAALKGRDLPDEGVVLIVQGLHHDIAIRAKPGAGIGIVTTLECRNALFIVAILLVCHVNTILLFATFRHNFY